MQPRTLSWSGDPTDRRVSLIRQVFLKALDEQSRNMINYYDFLLVAKKLNFRFEESTHLMELRKHFFSHKNQILNKKLAALLCVDEETLRETVADTLPEKIIIRFRVGSEEIESIKEVTNEDEEMADSEDEAVLPYSASQHLMPPREEDNQEYKEKLTIILSIKVAEMVKKIKLLVEGVTNIVDHEEHTTNLAAAFHHLTQPTIPYEIFRKGLVGLLKKLEAEFYREKLTMSEDDIRAVFQLVEEGGEAKRQALELLKDEVMVARQIAKFYEARINKRMVKNTLFKLGKNTNSIQIYQVKNASVLEFRTIQDGLLEPPRQREKNVKSRTPHFGPIKGSGLRQSPSKQNLSQTQHTQRHNHSSLTTYKRADDDNLDKQREKIERIIRTSKQDKKKPGKDTIANKLRKLFIHKVILPREKLLEEEKLKYGPNRSQGSNMIVKMM